MKFFVLFAILVFLIPVNFYTNNNIKVNATQSETTSTISPNQIKLNYQILLNKYIQALINSGEPTPGNGLRWKKYLNLPWNDSNPQQSADTYEYSQYYYGLYYGASGIGTFFLKLYESSGNSTYLTVAEQAGNFLIYSSSNTSFGYAWPRSDDSVVPYTSEKYGQAGISYFLLNLYKDSQNKTYLNYAVSNLQLLYDFKLKTSVGYAFNYSLPTSAQITDYIYGATGVAKAFLTAYQVTGNRTYLETCIKTISWVLNQTEYTSLNANGLRKVLYSPDPSYWYFFTGYQSGASGIGDFLLTLYNVTKQPDYLLYAQQLANWVVYEENGSGIWSSYNAVDYLTDQETTNDEGTFLGYSAGSSGMAIFLMDLYTVTKNSSYLGPVVRAKNVIVNQVISNNGQLYWRDQITGTFENRTDTGLFLGVAGIGLFFIKYYQFFGSDAVLPILNGINNFYGNITTVDGLVPSMYNSSQYGTQVVYDTSYFDGLAGIATFYLSVSNLVEDQPLYSTSVLNNIQNLTFSNTQKWIPLYNYNYTNTCSTVNCQSEVTYSVSSNSSKSNSVNFEFLPYAIVIIFTFIGVNRKRKNNH